MLLTASKRIRAGVSFDADVANVIKERAKKLEDLEVTRSEIVNAILADYLDGNGSSEAIWDVITKRRVKRQS